MSDEDFSDAVEGLLDSADVSEKTRKDFENQFYALRSDLVEVEECDHEDCHGVTDPQTMNDPLKDTVDLTDEGVQAVFHGNCDDCGAPVDAILKLEFDRGDD